MDIDCEDKDQMLIESRICEAYESRCVEQREKGRSKATS
jgi:hypothetical protein